MRRNGFLKRAGTELMFEWIHKVVKSEHFERKMSNSEEQLIF